MAVRKQTALRATNDCLKNVNQRTWAHFNLETKNSMILSHSKRIACYYFNFVIKPFWVTILVRDPGPFHTMVFLLCCTRGSNFKSVVEILADNDSIECYWAVPLYGTFHHVVRSKFQSVQWRPVLFSWKLLSSGTVCDDARGGFSF